MLVKKEGEIVRIQSIVPQAVIDKLKTQGMSINEGNEPPRIDMAIRVSPYELVEPYGPSDG
jgi:hypothetical protein